MRRRKKGWKVDKSATGKVVELVRDGLEKKLNGCSDREWVVLYQSDGVSFHFLCYSKDKTYMTQDYSLKRICDHVSWVEAEAALNRVSFQDVLASKCQKDVELLNALSSNNSRLMKRAHETGVYDFDILQESELESG
jgi:hypothetical protein